MASTPRNVRAWDVPTRLFHWTLALLIAAAWATSTYSSALGDGTLCWHRGIGYAVLVLIVWRLLWGFAGPAPVRFASFVRGPKAALRYGRDLATGIKRRFLGHNPLGGWMVLALLAAVSCQALLGLFTVEHNDLAAGPLYRLVSEEAYKPIRSWHIWTFNFIILPLVALHIAANLFYAFVLREPLIGAMLTGTRPAGDYEDGDGASTGSGAAILARALLCLAVAIVLVFAPLLAFGGRLL